MNVNVNENRIIKEFTDLVSIDSESFGERGIADEITAKLRELGFSVTEDNAGDFYGGNAGNIYGLLKGSADKQPILLSAHMDTVSPGCGKKAILRDDGTVTSSGATVLGADDIAGVVEILEGVRAVIESGEEHGDIEVLFPIGEEVYLKGTNRFDFGRIRSKLAYVFDMSGDVGAAAFRAPSLISFTLTVRGKAAHAGFAPENGINALAAASAAISRLDQGRIDEDTTFNVGTISGGTARNIVAEVCTVTGEVRSYSHERAEAQIELLKSEFERSAQIFGAEVFIDTTTEITAYRIAEDSDVIAKFKKACRDIGIEPRLTSTFGGSDNHNFVKNGISGAVISCGMYNVHSVREYTKVEELIKGSRLAARLILNQ